jgi:hypothetical protein
MINDRCTPDITGRRRVFWTTMMACDTHNVCGIDCAIPSLQYVDKSEGRTIRNEDWIRSLVLNILNTRARSDLKCPAPLATYGHWSESYREDGLYIGTRLFNMAEKPYIRIQDGVKAIGAAIRSDMGKLIILGLASDVDVNVVYKHRNRVDVTITITVNNTAMANSGKLVLNTSGTYATDTWVWN